LATVKPYWLGSQVNPAVARRSVPLRSVPFLPCRFAPDQSTALPALHSYPAAPVPALSGDDRATIKLAVDAEVAAAAERVKASMS